MARVNRREVLADEEIQVVHCVNRCVRRAFLCGVDPLTGMSYEHRRQWIRKRIEFLAGLFAIDVMGFSVMSNHLHLVLRNRPDIVPEWSDDEVAKRWWQLFPSRRNTDKSAAEPTAAELNAIKADASKLKELRLRLSSISWFMRCTSGVVARMANAEEECTGRFWEGRFKATVLTDEAAVAACMTYVDLNPIRAGIADSPEASEFTSIKERIDDLQQAEQNLSQDTKPSSASTARKARKPITPKLTAAARKRYDDRVEHGPQAGWVAPLELEPKRKSARQKHTGRRASNRGCLQMSLADYLMLVEWTGRQTVLGKRGRIPKRIPHLLERLDLSEELWLHTVQKFGKQRKVSSVTPATGTATSAPSPRRQSGTRR